VIATPIAPSSLRGASDQAGDTAPVLLRRSRRSALSAIGSGPVRGAERLGPGGTADRERDKGSNR
jgi:hypothetical protein